MSNQLKQAVDAINKGVYYGIGMFIVLPLLLFMVACFACTLVVSK